jgi:hypothetical protein
MVFFGGEEGKTVSYPRKLKWLIVPCTLNPKPSTQVAPTFDKTDDEKSRLEGYIAKTALLAYLDAKVIYHPRTLNLEYCTLILLPCRIKSFCH